MVKFLHTSDWHIGKTLRGRNRLEEQKAVLREISDIAVKSEVDAVLVAGDLYDHAVPGAAAQALAVRTLLGLARTGIEVVVIAGNHDHGATFEAYKPLMDASGIHVFGLARSADRGGVHSFTARSSGEQVNVAVLPWLSQRYAVRAAEIIANTPSENVGAYDQLVRDVLANLTAAFTPDAVNVIMAHLTCTNAVFGGGERSAQSIAEYHVPPAIFPAEAHYVALGHLHRRQQLPAACPVHYCGAPYPIDFGEQDNTSTVLLVEASPTTPAKVTDIEVTAGRRMRTVEGTVEQILTGKDSYGDDFLRLIVCQATYAGMQEELRAELPNVLAIRLHPDFSISADDVEDAEDDARSSKTPTQLFGEYCAETSFSDDRVQRLFDRLLDEQTPTGRG